MKKEITKTITETTTICDICNEPANYMCSVCYKDVCTTHMVIIEAYNSNSVYICNECDKKPFSEIWDKIYTILNTKITIYPVIQYKFINDYNTGDYWVTTPTITISEVYDRT